MYVAYGWPNVLAALEGQANQEDVVFLHLDHEFFIIVTTSRIQIWTGGQHRVKLGTFKRSGESLRAEGLNRKAFWSSIKRSLAVLVCPHLSYMLMPQHITLSSLTMQRAP